MTDTIEVITDEPMADFDFATDGAPGEARNFVEAYQVFTRVVNRLQRKYLELKDESERQSGQLAEANESLRKLSLRNRAITEFLNSILGSVSSGIVVVNRRGIITHFNAASETMFGVSAAEAVGKPYDQVVNAADKSSPSAAKLVSGNVLSAASRDLEKEIRVADHSTRLFLTGLSLLTDVDGRIFGAVEVFQDISDLHQMRQKMSRMEALAAVGEMAASVAHQVRNPLVSVKGFASLIARGSSPAETGAHAANILRGVDHLERVIDALLRFSRKETLMLKPTNLNRYLRKVIRQFNEREAELNQDNPPVHFISPERKLNVEVDQIVFREVVQNILQNARESCNRPVNISLELRQLSGSGDNGVEVTIQDDGPGIPEDQQREIFRPFYTTKSQGSGLGLALAKKMINAHGATITVESSPGKGSKFRIRFSAPASSEKSEETGTELSSSNVETDQKTPA